jgi:hypothetical protein
LVNVLIIVDKSNNYTLDTKGKSRAYDLVFMTSPSHGTRLLGKNDLFEYINIIELSDITEGHKKETRRALENYLNYVNWKIDKSKSLDYFKQLQNRCSIAY